MRKSLLLLLLITLLPFLALSAYAVRKGGALIDKGQSLNEPPTDEVRALVSRGVELAEDDRVDEAVAVLKKALSLSPNYLRAHIEYRKIRENYLGQFDEVEAEYESLLKREPDNPVYLMALYYRSNGSFGRGSLEKVAEIAPEWAWGHYAKALLLSDMEPEKAVGELLKCIEEEPSASEAYYRLIGLQETKLKRIEDAIATAEKFAAQPDLRAKGLAVLWRLRLEKANESEDAKESLKKELQKLAYDSNDIKLLRSISMAYYNLLKDEESARLIEDKIHRIDPTWYPTRGEVLSNVFLNESGVPRYVVLTNRQLAIYNGTREAAESPDPQERIRRREDLLSLNPNPVLKRLIYEDIFRLAVKSNDVVATLKYADALYRIDQSDTAVLAKTAMVLAKKRVGLNKALRYARIAEKATAEFRLTQRPPNTPENIFESQFPERKQRETYIENRATALDALGWVLYQRGNYQEAESALRKSFNARPSTARRSSLIAVLRKLGRKEEAERLAAVMNRELAELLKRNFVSEPVKDFQLESISGSRYALSGLKGKVVLINFWATWCGPCREELPVILKLYEKYKERGLEVMAISTDEERELVAQFAKQYRLTFPVFYDTAMKDYFKADVIPTSIFVGRDGKVRYRKIGFNEENIGELEAVINELIK
jgi:thiol-disulfide isomerase/thioredoxin/predicted Zn-dependent protease